MSRQPSQLPLGAPEGAGELRGGAKPPVEQRARCDQVAHRAKRDGVYTQDRASAVSQQPVEQRERSCAFTIGECLRELEDARLCGPNHDFFDVGTGDARAVANEDDDLVDLNRQPLQVLPCGLHEQLRPSGVKASASISEHAAHSRFQVATLRRTALENPAESVDGLVEPGVLRELRTAQRHHRRGRGVCGIRGQRIKPVFGHLVDVSNHHEAALARERQRIGCRNDRIGVGRLAIEDL